MAHHTKAEREKLFQRTPDNARFREEAAARCTKRIKRKVLKTQERKARAEHLGEMLLGTRKEESTRKVRGKPLSELYVNGNFTEDREEWQRELQRH